MSDMGGNLGGGLGGGYGGYGGGGFSSLGELGKGGWGVDESGNAFGVGLLNQEGNPMSWPAMNERDENRLRFITRYMSPLLTALLGVPPIGAMVGLTRGLGNLMSKANSSVFGTNYAGPMGTAGESVGGGTSPFIPPVVSTPNVTQQVDPISFLRMLGQG